MFISLQMPVKVLILIFLLNLAATQSYPYFKQCDPLWANQKLGTSSLSICQGGDLITSLSMGIALNQNYNPQTLNNWLKANRGYVQGNQYVWGSIGALGFRFMGFVYNRDIGKNIDAGRVLVLSVMDGVDAQHWVLATGYTADKIMVNDPKYTKGSYPWSSIIQGKTGVYAYSQSELPTVKKNLFTQAQK